MTEVSKMVYRIEELLPRFETPLKAANEAELRINALRSRCGGANHFLADKLEPCLSEGLECLSAACPLCFLEYRRWLFQQGMSLTEEPERWRFVTLVFYADALRSRDVSSFDLSKLRNRLRKKLSLIGFREPVFGGFEMDYDQKFKRWIPHFHLIMPNRPGLLKVLRKYMKRPCVMRLFPGKKKRPMRIDRLKSRPKQISYLLKSFWTLKLAHPSKEKGGRRRKVRLDAKRQALFLRTIDRYGFTSLTFLYGLRVVRGRLLCSKMSSTSQSSNAD